MNPSKINNNTSFIQKLMNLLEVPIVQIRTKWLDTNNGFNIVNVSGFTQNVLPAYFKHSNYSSFVRQLNMYGFNKIRGKQGDNIYEHRNFKRGSKACVKKIQRKVGLQANQKVQEIVLYNKNVICERKKKENEIQKLKIQQVELESKCINLLERNKSLLQQNQMIVEQIRNQEKKKKRLIEQIINIINSSKSQKDSPQEYQGIGDVPPEVGHQDHLQFLQKQKPLNILDLNEQKEYLSLDAFLNIDDDELSQAFKL